MGRDRFGLHPVSWSWGSVAMAAFVANDFSPHLLILFFGVGGLAGLPTLERTRRS